jgi:chemotaxis protein CheD
MERGDRVDVVLSPGEFYFGNGDLRIGTLLGSCVAITLWHPQTRSGGMCHYLLPGRAPSARIHAGRLDGRYGDEAMLMFMHEIQRTGTHPSEYQAKIFGGGNQFPHQPRPDADHRIDIPERNVESGLELLDRYGFPPVAARHLGGSGARQVVLNLLSGDVWLRHSEITVVAILP